ncbi:MAG TPA: cytochrome b/b6 domain-containing protein, partial [Gammaproteobacteria bacterium]|nr:cytochrome b/b6 domain-containing protein [Gammaproteobacteria bacterium]
HYSLYAMLIAMPISGWVMSAAAGRAPRWGNLVLNLPIEKNESLSGLSFNIHYWLAIVIIVFVSLHVAAALFHHFVKKDDVLKRMLP